MVPTRQPPKQEDHDERTRLIVQETSVSTHHHAKSKHAKASKFLFAVALATIVGAVFVLRNENVVSSSSKLEMEMMELDHHDNDVEVERLGASRAHHSKHKHKKDKYIRHKHEHTFLSHFETPPPRQRCQEVMDLFLQRDKGTPPDDLRKRYVAQSVDPNVFYRATAHIFWADFTSPTALIPPNFTRTFLLHNDPDSIDDGESTSLEERFREDPENVENIQKVNGVPLVPTSVWTWVTGDQHLSNFGAWRNRHGDIVFGVNDFDEAAIYDFQIDILRIAVSICSHAITNKFTDDQVTEALRFFTDSYVETIVGYKDNENALLFELTPDTATGELRDFLYHTKRKKSSDKLVTKFTTRSPVTNQRHFIKGGVDAPHPDTRLASVPPVMVEEIKQAFNETQYGATMMKMGWAVLPWDATFFRVLDVAERIGSGIGSFGVDRYYVLLKGRDGLLLDDGEDGSAIILDVKFQPISAVSRVLNTADSAWYNVMFPNEAARVVQAQRKLTSYTDPFTGWVMLRNLDPTDSNYGERRPFSVRQRSPWKDSPDLDELTDPDDFNDYMRQIAQATATSHVRGSVAKAPGDFKHVIAAVLGCSSHKRKEWGKVMAKTARAYREQVLMDFECFRNYVQEKYNSTG